MIGVSDAGQPGALKRQGEGRAGADVTITVGVETYRMVALQEQGWRTLLYAVLYELLAAR